ncbi:MAG: type VI secretion system tube protein Hcp, partial [Burkholderiales bacterium]
HVNASADGSLGAPTLTGWDFEANKALGAPDPSADGAKAALVPAVDQGASLDYYIKFDGVGDGKWLSLDAFSLGFDNQVSLGSSGGGVSAGKVTASDLSSLLGSSALSAELAAALTSGEHIKDVQIEAYQSGGDKGSQLIDEFKFSDVQIDGLQTGGSGGGIANEVSFLFAQYGQTHVTYDGSGQVSSTDGTGWDFAADKSAGAPAVQADAAKTPLEPQVGPQASLEYYVHVDGVNGWLQVDSFSMGLSNPVTLGTGGGGSSAGRAHASDVSMTLGMSAALVQLEADLFKGANLQNVEVEVYQAGGSKGPQLVDEFQFKDVVVDSLSSADVTSNALSFAYGAYTHGHVNASADGSLGAPTLTGWDFEANHAITPPAPHPDVDLFS